MNQYKSQPQPWEFSCYANKPLISVVIPNWNGSHLLPECLNSLKRQTFNAFQVIIVDNGSSDDSLTLIAEEFPWVRVIALSGNSGFSAAVNTGIRQTSTAYIVLLNNDTRADPGWLDALYQGMKNYPEASMAASRMLLHDPPHRVDSAGDGYSLLKGIGYNLWAGETAESVGHDAWVFGACAGAAIYRRKLFDDIGLFDEDFFLNFEDVDIALRAQVAGHRCVYLANAIVYHKRGASTDTKSLTVISRSWRNSIWVAGKNLPPMLLIIWGGLFCLRGLIWLLKASATHCIRESKNVADVIDQKTNVSDDRRQRTKVQYYWPVLKAAIVALPQKRRALRALRRLGTIQLFPILIKPHRPIDYAGQKNDQNAINGDLKEPH